MEIRILRVFPQRTSFTPDDDMVWIGEPGFFIPEHDEVHISCTFTWDMDYCEQLQFQWQGATDKPVRLGGPAYESPCDNHIPGLYTKAGITFTSRGCNNNCSFCFVPKREGKLRELEIKPGNIVQDNNFLQTSREHQENVFKMLQAQHGICFKGGLENRLVNEWFAEQAKVVKTQELWLACDTDGALPSLEKASAILHKAGFSRNQIYCYALIGKNMEKEEVRLRQIFEAGAMPRAQLYQPPGRKRKKYSKEWEHFQRTWDRPPATKAYMKGANQNDDGLYRPTGGRQADM